MIFKTLQYLLIGFIVVAIVSFIVKCLMYFEKRHRWLRPILPIITILSIIGFAYVAGMFIVEVLTK